MLLEAFYIRSYYLKKIEDKNALGPKEFTVFNLFTFTSGYTAFYFHSTCITRIHTYTYINKMDRFKHLQILTDEELSKHSELCVFTQGTRKVRAGEAYRCKEGHITFVSATGIDSVFAAIRAMKRKDAHFDVSIYGKMTTIKTGGYNFQGRRTKASLDKLDQQPKTNPCAVCFATTRSMGTHRADLDSLMTACPVSLLLKEALHRQRSKKEKKIKKVVKGYQNKCFYGTTCPRLIGKDCLTGCPNQLKYEQKMERKAWQEQLQREMEEAAVARKLEEEKKEHRKRMKEIRRCNFFATRIQKVLRGFLVRKKIQMEEELWYSDLLIDLPTSGGWDNILKQLTVVEYDSEELLQEASIDEVIAALGEINFSLAKHKARYLLKIIKRRTNILSCSWSVMKPGYPPRY